MRTAMVGVAALALLVGCGAGQSDGRDSQGPPFPDFTGASAVPRAAWLDDDHDTQVVAGDVEETVEFWEPFLWLPNGDLVLHTAADSSGMAVYRPSEDDIIAETDDEWGEDEFGLDGVTGAVMSDEEELLSVDEHGPEEPDELVVQDFELEEVDRIELPEPDDDLLRRYQPPVASEGATMVPYYDVPNGGTDEERVYGLVRVEDGEVVADEPSEITGLFLSEDRETVLGVTSGFHAVIVDPDTGEVDEDLGELPVPREPSAMDHRDGSAAVRYEQREGDRTVYLDVAFVDGAWEHDDEASDEQVWYVDGGRVVDGRHGVEWQPDEGGDVDLADDVTDLVVAGSLIPFD
ncbi:MAG: hypothetical protein QM621_06010 [Aeromicrobium sp.]|uniref:hypothetical protein n=1 Tax=Aeromicrobium sp. TaxID=1871063 RepID=UPI0039E4138B